jgi:hypothetical protein
MKVIIEKLESKKFMQNLVITIASNILILMFGLILGYLLKQFLL